MIFQYISYQDYLLDFFKNLPNEGRGQPKRLSEHLGVSSVVVSQVLNKQREFSMENAFKVTQFLELNSFETNYFLKMVEYAKAGSFELKEYLKQELIKLQEESKKLTHRYTDKNELSDEDKFTFYSDPLYSSIRMASSLPHLNTIEQISEYFHLPSDQITKILNFLVSRNLCTINEGKIQRGKQNTFIPADSPYIKLHHSNWRKIAIDKSRNLSASELMYTAPMTLSQKDFELVRENLLKTIQDTVKILGPSEDEVMACLNIDFFKI